MSSIQLTPAIAAIPMAAELATAEIHHAVVNQAATVQFTKEVLEQQSKQVNKLEKSSTIDKVKPEDEEEKRRRQGRGKQRPFLRRGAELAASENASPVAPSESHAHSESPFEGRFVNRRV